MKAMRRWRGRSTDRVHHAAALPSDQARRGADDTGASAVELATTRKAPLCGLRRGDDGASAVEFALVVPWLLLLMFGMINYGAVFAQQLALNNGVRQGARSAVVAGNLTSQQCGQIISAVQAASGPALGIDTTNIAVQTEVVDSINPRLPDDAAHPKPLGTTCAGRYQTSSADTTRACANSLDTSTGEMRSLRVKAQYQSKFLLPWPMPMLSAPVLTATAFYKCEYS